MRAAGAPGWRTRVRSRTGSVEASAAPRIAAPAGGRPSSSQAASADERGREERARPQDEQREPPLLPHFADVDGDGVAEQHQHQGQRGEDLRATRRLERELDHAQPGGAQHGAEEEEDRDLGHARPLDRARQQRRGDDDDADERERGDEGIVEHGPQYGSGYWRSPPAAW